jgi:hypothetical protein
MPLMHAISQGVRGLYRRVVARQRTKNRRARDRDWGVGGSVDCKNRMISDLPVEVGICHDLVVLEGVHSCHAFVVRS